MQSPPPNSPSAALPNASRFVLPGAPAQEKDFWQHLQMVQRRWVAICTVGLATLSFSVWRSLTTPTVYEGRFRLLVEPINQPNRALATLTDGNAADSRDYDYDTQIQILQSPELLGRSLKQLSTTRRLDYGELRNGLNIIRIPKTKLLEVRYRSDSSGEIRAVLEQLAKDYLAYSVNEREVNLNQGLKFVDSQAASVRARVDQLQRQLQAFRQNNNLMEPEAQSSRFAGQADQLTQQRNTLNQEIIKAQAALNELQGENGAVTALNTSPTYQSLVQQLQKLQTQIALESTRFGDNSSAIQDLKDKRTNLLMMLREEAKSSVGIKAAQILTELQGLQVQRQAIARLQQNTDQMIEQFPALSRQYTDLQRELKIATSSLERFLTTRETLQVEASQKKVPWQVTDPPSQQATLISPNIPQDVAIGAVASLALGIGAALLLEKLDSTYRTSEELGKALRVPILGKIVHQSLIESEDDRQWFSKRRRRTQRLDSGTGTALSLPIATLRENSDDSPEFIESFRILRTNLTQAKPSQAVRSIVVSSVSMGDGKSTISLYLAQTAAEMGQRVLLVDADFRRSQLQGRLDLPDEGGLCQFVLEGVPLQEVVQQPYADLPFYVLPRGADVFDPVKVITSPEMPSAMKRLSQLFDLVIYDTPPLHDIADAVLLAPHTDGLVLVVRLRKTDRSAVTKTLENLAISNIPVLGIAANDA